MLHIGRRRRAAITRSWAGCNSGPAYPLNTSSRLPAMASAAWPGTDHAQVRCLHDPARVSGSDLMPACVEGTTAGQSWGWPLRPGAAESGGLHLDDGGLNDSGLEKFTIKTCERAFAFSEIMVCVEYTGRGLSPALCATSCWPTAPSSGDSAGEPGQRARLRPVSIEGVVPGRLTTCGLGRRPQVRCADARPAALTRDRPTRICLGRYA